MASQAGMLLSCLVFLALCSTSLAFLQIKNGYFWDPSLNGGKGDHWVATGITYQTWNLDLGEWESQEQLEYDLREMKKMGANSIRVDFVWKQIEAIGDNIFNWTRYDILIETATKYDLKIFALVGYQWPPTWFSGTPFEEGNNVDPGMHTEHPPSPDAGGPGTNTSTLYQYKQKWVSDIIGYETPAARTQYQQWLAEVGSHYKNSAAIGGWIVGNEFGYIGLWSYRQDGYDPHCQAAFAAHMSTKYNGDIAAMNAYWGTSFASFDAITFPPGYDRENKEWGDVVQWREDSIANFLGEGAAAIKAADPNHLISYSTVGMIWGPEDWRYHAEDTGKIVSACENSSAPLDFWSINNYPNGMAGDELRTGRWGFAFAKWKTEKPVMLSETGFTSTENLFPVFTDQGILIRNALWDAMMAGSIGIHVFNWNDRLWLTPREKGFGIVGERRTPKVATQTMKEWFISIQQLNFPKLFAASPDTKKDIAFYWTSATDQMYNRYQANHQAVWGPLERLGFEPYYLSQAQLFAGDYKKYKAIVLPRNQRMYDGDLAFIRDHVIPSGVHVIVDGDLPGMENYQLVANPAFPTLMNELFGITVQTANKFQDKVTEYEYGIQRTRVDLLTVVNLDSSVNVTRPTDVLYTWKYHYITAIKNSNVTVVGTMRLADEEWANERDMVVIKNHGTAKTWLNAASLADLLQSGSAGWGALPNKSPWAQHSDWFRAVLFSKVGFGITSPITIKGSDYVQVDTRNATDGRILIGVMNWSDDTTETVTVTIPEIKGRNLRYLQTNQLIESNTDGVFSITLHHNDMFMLVADHSPAAMPFISIVDMPLEVVPQNRWETVTIHYEANGVITTGQVDIVVAFINSKTGVTLSTARKSGLPSRGDVNITITIPDANPLNPTYISSVDGGAYIFKVYLLKTGQAVTSAVANTSLPTRLAWGVRPVYALPKYVAKGQAITINSSWSEMQELARKWAFPSRVAVYYSTKTANVDWAHGLKVGAIRTWLEANGYMFTYLGPLQEDLKWYGRSYCTIADTDICNNGLCDADGSGDSDGELLNLNTYYLTTYFDAVIVAGTWVMSDAEINNLIGFLSKPDSKLIATEGCVGCLTPSQQDGSSRMAAVFGTTGAYYEAVDYHANVTVTKLVSHPIPRDYGTGATFPVLTRVDSKFFKKLIPGATALGTVSVDEKTFPALIINNYKNASVFTWNFDATTTPSNFLNESQLTSPKTAPGLLHLAQRLTEWITLSNQLLKIQWTLTDKTSGAVLASSLHWVNASSGSSSLALTSNSASSSVIWTAYLYPWNSTTIVASRMGFYTSSNDVQPLGVSLSRTPSRTRSRTRTRTPSHTRSRNVVKISSSHTRSKTRSRSPSHTRSRSPSHTRSRSPSHTRSRSRATPSKTASRSHPKVTPTRSRSRSK